MAGPDKKKQKAFNFLSMASSSAKKTRQIEQNSLSDSLIDDGNNNKTINASQHTLKAAYDPQTTHLCARSSLLAQLPQSLCTKNNLVEIKLSPAKNM